MTPFHQNHYYFQLVNDCVMTRTVDGIISFWNHSAEKLYGWRKEEAVGKVSHDLLQTQFPKPLQDIESELVRDGRWEGKLVHTTRNGGHVVVESRWTLDLNGPAEAVIETNTPCTKREMDSDPLIERHSLDIGREEPVAPSKLKPADVVPEIANIILVAGAFFCLLVLFYSMYYYELTADRRFSTAFGILLYWVFPAVLATLLFAFLRRSREARIRAALLFISITVSLYAVELTLAILNPPFRSSVTFWGGGGDAALHREEVSALAKKAGIDFDFRTKLEVVRDLRQTGVGAVPSVFPAELLTLQPDDSFKSKIAIDGMETLPLGGISNRVTVLCNETGDYIIYNSDERGFHNPKGVWDASVTIAALGDSFTVGSCVPSDKNFVSVIREQYSDTLNLGMLGKGPLTMLATLREYLPLLKPKVVLWFYFEDNDFRDLLKESKTPLLRKYLEEDFNQGLFHRQTDIDQALTAYVEESIKAELGKTKEDPKATSEDPKATSEDANDTSYLLETLESFFKLRYLRHTLGKFFESAVQRPEQKEYSKVQLNLFRNVLLEAKESVGGWKGTLYFVYLPARDRYANKLDYRRQSVLAVVRDIGVPIIDVHARFQLQSDPLSLFPFGRFGHYNEEGNRLVAEEVLRAIVPGRE